MIEGRMIEGKHGKYFVIARQPRPIVEVGHPPQKEAPRESFLGRVRSALKGRSNTWLKL